MEHDSRLDIEVAAYETFMAFQQVGELQQQCLGQMFYNCFACMNLLIIRAYWAYTKPTASMH